MDYCRRRLGRRLTRLITLDVYVTKCKFPPDKLIALTISGSEQSDWIRKLCHLLLLRPHGQQCLTDSLALTINNGSVDNYAGKEVYYDNMLLYLTPGTSRPNKESRGEERWYPPGSI